MGATWGLLIATLNREPVLLRCIEQALASTRPPSEVVVVDGSADWEGCRDRLRESLGARLDGIRWHYEGATRLSSAAQRNACVDAATADVLFLIDDDSLLFPEAAEEVMAVYEADVERQVAGVTMAEVAWPPDAPPAPDPAGQAPGALPDAPTLLQRMERALAEQELRFLPYDGRYHVGPVPPSLAHLDVVPQGILGGFRMTFRREVIADVRFSEHLERYAIGEDFDASYRASRRGLLLMATRARIHHLQVSGGRPNRRLRSAFTCLNVVAMNGFHAPPEGLRHRCRGFLARRLGISLAIDLGRGRPSLPETRGVLLAWRHAEPTFALRGSALASYHRNL